MARMLKIHVERGTQSYDSLAGRLGKESDVVLAVTLDRNFVAQCYVNDQTRDFLKNDLIGRDPDWCSPCYPIDCCTWPNLVVMEAIRNAVGLCLGDLSRELYPDIFKELHPDDKSAGKEC